MNSFQSLISTIQDLHHQLQLSALNAVNQFLTIRNWLIGNYIVEFEQYGRDRAEYGTFLLKSIAERLDHIPGLDERSLRRFRLLYLYYPQLADPIRGTLTPKFANESKWVTLSPIFQKPTNESRKKIKKHTDYQIAGEKILASLSYSHFELLLSIDDPLKRFFFEAETIKGCWSVRELRRQINSMYFERSGLSQNPEKLIQLVHQKINPRETTDIIKNIYAFEFLDLPVKEILEESDLEKALLSNIQNFIVEMGHGFCFEARQKRILIGEKYYFIDLVFYHRILKCHVLIELKMGEFEHGDIGQLNTYVSYYKQEVLESGDNFPIGILLVAEKDHALVKYATAGMDENLFIKKYLLKLPNTEVLENYIKKELNSYSAKE